MPSKNKNKAKRGSKLRKSNVQAALTPSRSIEDRPAVNDTAALAYGDDSEVFSGHDDALSNSISDGSSEYEASDTNSQEEHGAIAKDPIPASAQRRENTGFQRSQSYGPDTFAPPFYNRPPTPLPPSPSLSSLLRPRPFGASLSRTTTPESSDTEATGNLMSSTATLSSTDVTVAQSAQAARAPRASPKVPTYEYYGFVLYIGSSAAFLVYLLWSYLPAAFLHKLGIYYYPNRWWSLAIPAWLVVLVIYIYVALAAWNTGRETLPLGSIECIVDEKAQIAVIDTSGNIMKDSSLRPQSRSGGPIVYGRAGIGVQSELGGKQEAHALPSLDWKHVWNEGTDGVMDIPIGGVSVEYRGQFLCRAASIIAAQTQVPDFTTTTCPLCYAAQACVSPPCINRKGQWSTQCSPAFA